MSIYGQLVLLQDGASSYRHSKQIMVWLAYLKQTQNYYFWDAQFSINGKAKIYLDSLVDRFAYFGQICNAIFLKKIEIEDIDGFVFDRLLIIIFSVCYLPTNRFF
jgi:hypothetical protein